MDLRDALRKLGLSETEAKIYLALLKNKESTAVQLAKKTEVHRRTIYDNLNILLRRGIVSFKIKNGVKYFQATNPESLKIFLEEKSKILGDVLPELKNFYDSEEKSPKINVFVGLEGAKAVVEGAIKSKKNVYWVGGGLFFFKALKLSRKFIEQKMKKMKMKTVQPNIPEVKDLLSIIKKENIRVLPKNFLGKVGYMIYEDVVIIGIIQEKEITTIQIINEDSAKAFTNYFNMMWDMGKPL
jgi:HTH-type transcriptional regulator, sugar sensing transcriptional regulator